MYEGPAGGEHRARPPDRLFAAQNLRQRPRGGQSLLFSHLGLGRLLPNSA
jgi:hypothetical protein